MQKSFDTPTHENLKSSFTILSNSTRPFCPSGRIGPRLPTNKYAKAYLPAKNPTPRSRARFSVTYEHKGRSCSPGTSPGQGQNSADRLASLIHWASRPNSEFDERRSSAMSSRAPTGQPVCTQVSLRSKTGFLTRGSVFR